MVLPLGRQVVDEIRGRHGPLLISRNYSTKITPGVIFVQRILSRTVPACSAWPMREAVRREASWLHLLRESSAHHGLDQGRGLLLVGVALDLEVDRLELNYLNKTAIP
jgi:hypothetical protein